MGTPRLLQLLWALPFASAWATDYIKVTGNDTAPSFSLTNAYVSYQFHVNETTGDLGHDHFGAPVAEVGPPVTVDNHLWSTDFANTRREFPDSGRGDYRPPAIHILHSSGDTVSALKYQYHTLTDGKPALPGLPATFGSSDDVSTLTVHMWDNYSSVSADLHYSIFHDHGVIARSFNISNWGQGNITIERASSWSIDMPGGDYEMLELHGDWAVERQRILRHIDYGTQGFSSNAGYSSHYYSPFYGIGTPYTSENLGEAYGFNLVYTGSFSAQVERFSHGFVRAQLGLNPLQLSWPLAPGETFTAPEVVGAYSNQGYNGMSQQYHDVFRAYLSRSNLTSQARPPLLNSWEGFHFAINDSSLRTLAHQTAGLGISLFVLDDGWFGTDYPRNNDSTGLGDFQVNPAKFPDGLGPFVDAVNTNSVNGTNGGQLGFGIWVEPEMVDPASDLYTQHPDWVLHTRDLPRQLVRNQLVLNLAMPEVQDHIITEISALIDSANIRYIKWDNNRGIKETPSPATDHAYMLGLYRVIDTLSSKYPDVLWEGCASGGGRFDAGLLHYWPQSWTSDNTDAIDRLYIQFGTTVLMPPSAMGCHVSDIPNGQTGRNTSFTFRGHVAMMCGSFGFELDPNKLTDTERSLVPQLLAEAKQISPLVINGTFYRLALPEKSNWPAVQFISQDGSQVVVLAYQMRSTIKPVPPPLRLQGLGAGSRYQVASNQFNGTLSGSTLMNSGLNPLFKGDADSQVIWLYRQ